MKNELESQRACQKGLVVKYVRVSTDAMVALEEALERGMIEGDRKKLAGMPPSAVVRIAAERIKNAVMPLEPTGEHIPYKEKRRQQRQHVFDLARELGLVYQSNKTRHANGCYQVALYKVRHSGNAANTKKALAIADYRFQSRGDVKHSEWISSGSQFGVAVKTYTLTVTFW